MKKEEEKIKKIIENSGNGFHYKVVNFLREREWKVLVCPYYNDHLSDKAKEIDLVAEKLFPVKDGFDSTKGHIKVRFFIECKYINSDIVFWFDKRDEKKSRKLVIETTPLREDNSYTDVHHYLIEKNNDVAKLYSSNANKENVIFKALIQSLNSMIYFKYNAPSINHDIRTRFLSSISYPVILTNSFDYFYKFENKGEKSAQLINSNFLLEVNYAYLDYNKKSRNDYFLVDVIDFNKFDSFLEEFEKNDINSISKMIDR